MKEDYIARGFQKIHDDLDFLMTCFREVLEELGEGHLATNLPWINPVRIDLAPNPRLCQAYSIAFQLLNVHAQSRLRDRQQLRCPPEAAELGDLDETPQFSKSNGHSNLIVSQWVSNTS